MINLTIRVRPLGAILALTALLAILLTPSAGYSQSDSRYFPETQHWVKGRFLEHWTQNGGLSQQGYPLTEEFQEQNKLNGQTYTVQYFERAVFEAHPENAAPFDVLLSQLGKFELAARYPNNSNPAAAPVGSGGTVPPQPTQTAPPAATGESVTKSGEGTMNSEQFRLSGGNYKVEWSARDSTPGDTVGCFHGGFLRSVDGNVFENLGGSGILEPGATKTGGTNLFNLPATDYYFDVNSGCAWTITIARQ